MINLLQENIEMKSPRENSTFGFCRHAEKPTRKNQKSYFLPTLTVNIEETDFNKGNRNKWQ